MKAYKVVCNTQGGYYSATGKHVQYIPDIPTIFTANTGYGFVFRSISDAKIFMYDISGNINRYSIWECEAVIICKKPKYMAAHDILAFWKARKQKQKIPCHNVAYCYSGTMFASSITLTRRIP